MSSVGDLVAHLTLNHAGFRQGFAAAQGVAARGAAGITAAIAPLAGALAAALGVGSSLSAAREDERALRKLEAVLKATGGAAGLSAEQISEYATELQRSTNFADEATVGAAAVLATLKNIKGDNFKQAISLAQDMATVLEIDVDTAAKKLVKTLNGLSTEDAAKKLQELKGQFGGASAAVTDPWIQLKNAIGDIGEQIGYILLPAVNAVSEALVGVANNGIPAFESIRQTVQDFVDGAVVAYSTLGDSAYLFYLQSELAIVQTGLAFAHFFNEELPIYFDWFSENWFDIFMTAADWVATVFINIGTNIRGAWQAILDFISGSPVTFDWTPLTEGFVSTIKDMPDIPDRLKTELEKGLESDIANQKRVIEQAQAEMSDKILADRKAKEDRKGFVLGEGVYTAEKTAKDVKVSAAQKGSAEALSAIFAAMGSGKGIPEKQLDAEEEQVALLDDMRDSLRTVADNITPVFVGSLPA